MMPDTVVSSDLNVSQSSVAEPAFACTLRDDGFGATWVCVAGELDHATAPRLASMLAKATRLARIVVVDLRELTRVDSTGVGAIVDASYSARRDGRRLVIVRGLPRVERLLALIGASHVVEIVELAAGEPLALALLQIARNDRAGKPKRPRRFRRFSLPVRSSVVPMRRLRVLSEMTLSMDRAARRNTVSRLDEENIWASERASS
jgi:anti-sigma B factor antagonist